MMTEYLTGQRHSTTHLYPKDLKALQKYHKERQSKEGKRIPREDIIHEIFIKAGVI